jgi:putative SbcD/Mre11-related phosphoesterase
MEIEPVPDEAALRFGRSLIVADLHIGIEEEFRKRGYSIPSLTPHMERKLLRLIDSFDVDNLIIAGDIKHGIIGSRQDYREVGMFLENMVEHVQVEIVKGNHDGGIQHLRVSQGKPSNGNGEINEVKVHGPKGLKINDFGIVHGHAHPSIDLMKSRVLVMAHEHPVVRFVDGLGVGVNMKTWMRVRFKDSGKGPEELIVMPAFNDYLGGTSVNSSETKFLSPLLKKKLVDIGNAKLYLLDGTFLGKRKDLIQLDDIVGNK